MKLQLPQLKLQLKVQRVEQLRLKVLHKQPKVALKQAGAVFEGKVLGIAATPETHRVTARFEVLRVWKGELTARTEVTTIDVGSMCGFAFTVGDSYLVYADGEATALSTGTCSRTKASAGAKEDFADFVEQHHAHPAAHVGECGVEVRHRRRPGRRIE